jgi:hypothetical protein
MVKWRIKMNACPKCANSPIERAYLRLALAPLSVQPWSVIDPKNKFIFSFSLCRARQVKAIAHAGLGKCEMVTDADNIADKVLRQMSRALQPALCNVSVDWSGLVVAPEGKSDPLNKPAVKELCIQFCFALCFPASASNTVVHLKQGGAMSSGHPANFFQYPSFRVRTRPAVDRFAARDRRTDGARLFEPHQQGQ